MASGDTIGTRLRVRSIIVLRNVIIYVLSLYMKGMWGELKEGLPERAGRSPGPTLAAAIVCEKGFELCNLSVECFYHRTMIFD